MFVTAVCCSKVYTLQLPMFVFVHSLVGLLCVGTIADWRISYLYVCLVCCKMTISLIAKCLDLNLHTCCVRVYVCAGATCVSKQLSQIYSLAQIFTCYLARVHPA